MVIPQTQFIVFWRVEEGILALICVSAEAVMTQRQIFEAALEIADPGERHAYLANACADDTDLRKELDELISAQQKLGSFLDQPIGQPAGTMNYAPITEKPGSMIGPYKLKEQIGEGGFGLVFVAEQTEPVKRKVALKVIKPGMDTREVMARFEAERQALALMDHPNIAKVLDAGSTDSGRPYFLMELVKGLPITEFCDQHHLSPRQRLELFILVCQAVQHAHQKGIIHRDLKPSNVLVSRHDTTPIVKVIDFGVAKAMGPALTDKTFFTGIAQMIGTPMYMSPEQAGMSDLDIDTRSDIYPLGVLMYELLTGTTPFSKERFKQAAYDEIRRIIREEEPPKPSTRLSTSDTLPSIAANRGLEPKRLSGLIRGELDWIAMKALEKDRNRRYETANAFAADIQRYLADEPVQAGRPSTAYRLRKFVRRNRRAVFAGSLVLLSLVVGVIGTSVALIQAKFERDGKDKALASEQRIAYFGRVALAQREFEGYNVGRADQLLDECPEILRGWEWHYLQRLRYGSSPVFTGHVDQVTGVTVSPNGQLIASAGADKTVKFWDATTRHFDPLDGPAERVWCVAFSPDGLRLAAGGREKTVDGQAGQIKIWDTSSRKVIRTIAGHIEDVSKVAFSPDGLRLASASVDGTVKIWDSHTGVEQRELVGHQEWVMDVTFSHDSKYVATASRDKTVQIWEAETGRRVHVLEGHGEWASGVAFNHDGRRVASAGYDSRVLVWDLSTESIVLELNNPCPTMAVAFSPDGQRLASAGWDKTVKIWDPQTGEEILTLRGHTQVVTALAFSGDGRRLVTGSDDRTLRLWDGTPLRGRLPFELFTLPHTNSVSVLAYSHDGRQFASAGLGRVVTVWDPNTGQLLHDLNGHTSMIWGIAFNADGRRLASTSWDRTVRVWNTSTWQCIELPHEAAALGVAFAPNKLQLATSSYDGTVRIWNLETESLARPAFKLTNNPPINALAYSPNGKYLVMGAEDGLVRVLNADSVEELSFSPLRGHNDCVQGIAISPDGKYIASASYDGTARIWDAATGQLIHTLQGETKERVPSVAFSPDSRYLASAGLDGTARIWDIATGRELRTLRGHNRMVWCVAFSPDGKQLAAGGGHRRKGDIRIWDVTALDLDAAAQSK
jgi:WD40 repeat protein/serine/threonine protein kinase